MTFLLALLAVAATPAAPPSSAPPSAVPNPAAPNPAAPERASWYSCLEDYAQVAMASTGTAVTIALETDRACAAERKTFQVALLHSRAVPGDASVLTARFAVEDRAAYEHVIGFVNRMR